MMEIESVTPCRTGGVFVVFILDNREPYEMHFDSEGEAIAWMNFINGKQAQFNQQLQDKT